MAVNPKAPEMSTTVDTLYELESRMERAESEVYQCLRRIQTEKLYKNDYPSFEVYCQQRWGFSRSRAYQLIDYGKLCDRLRDKGIDTIPSEGQVRPLLQGKSYAIRSHFAKDEDDFLDRAANTVEITLNDAPKKFDIPQTRASDFQATAERFGQGRRKDPGTPYNVKEIRQAITKFVGSRAFAEGSGDYFIDKHGDCLDRDKLALVYDWIGAYLEVG